MQKEHGCYSRGGGITTVEQEKREGKKEKELKYPSPCASHGPSNFSAVVAPYEYQLDPIESQPLNVQVPTVTRASAVRCGSGQARRTASTTEA